MSTEEDDWSAWDEPESMAADHCGACLEMVPGWSISNGEEPTCPHCGADPLVLIQWRQVRERIEAIEREIAAATTDGLIRWGK